MPAIEKKRVFLFQLILELVRIKDVVESWIIGTGVAKWQKENHI
jgi:hypothetical protein